MWDQHAGENRVVGIQGDVDGQRVEDGQPKRRQALRERKIARGKGEVEAGGGDLKPHRAGDDAVALRDAQFCKLDFLRVGGDAGGGRDGRGIGGVSAGGAGRRASLCRE